VKRAWAITALLAILTCAPRAGAEPLHAASPFLRDAANRVVFFHGVNAVWKLAPYVPSAAYFDDSDGQFLADNGFNSVRLGVLWAGVEPTEGTYDENYLDRIAAIVDMLNDHGIRVLLDFHQDMYNEKYAGEGFPDWAVHDDDFPNLPVFGFPGNYFLDPALFHAFDNLWLDRDELWAKYRAFWKHVAHRFKRKRNLLGYDLLNEPWPGAQWPTCVNPAGCPQWDLLFLQPFHENVIAGIREVDAHTPVWWEPQVIDDGGAGNSVGLLSPIADPKANQGISFHVYALAALFGSTAPPVLSGPNDPVSPLNEELVFRQQAAAASRNGSALLVTEFGASDSIDEINRVAALADQHQVSWHYWAFGNWGDPTGSSTEGLFTDDLDRPGSLKQLKADALIRTYPQAVAGTPQSFSFDPTSKEFTLAYQADRAITAPTVVFVPVARHYGGHYSVSIDGLAAVNSPADAPLLVIQNTGGGSVNVRVTKNP
jgi:endoglycosylceramidase